MSESPIAPPQVDDTDRAPTPGETAQPILTEAEQTAAIQDEQAAVQEAVQAHLQNRVVTLNMEVRIRDQKIADLEARLEGTQAELETVKADLAEHQASVPQDADPAP